jgi:Heavy metal associated domain 2
MTKYDVSPQVHYVPGRLRLKLASIKRNEARARCAEERLGELDGIRKACANPLTGSLVVRFDPCITSVDAIFDALKAQGLLDREGGQAVAAGNRTRYAAAATPLISPESLADMLAKKAVESLLERCALALVAALI